MIQLRFSEAELYDDYEHVKPHVRGGVRMHGGFDAAGRYLPPRSRGRRKAMDAWTKALRERGGDLFAADASLLTGARMPNVAQQTLLLRSGIGQPFWNSLTITGKIEARGRILAEMEFPDLQNLVVEDISETALGHLNKGLLVMHGIDEGGEPDKGIGGHDVMWFVARDLAFGPDAYPDVEPPENIARPEAGQRLMPELAPEYEGMISFLMNLLLIEFRAEIGFASTQEILRNPELFTDRRAEAEEAAEIVGRIREDERIHVESLRLYLGELAEATLRTVDGGTIRGASLIDRFWEGLVRWATVDQPAIAARNQYEALKPMILAHPDGQRIIREFDALSDLAGETPAAASGR
ncbi:MAG: hypothetical protein PVH91_07045 [Pseudomonadales bacterium]|jgi:hypothetical protein